MSVLISGGAGYIGAHVVDLLSKQGVKTVVVDDFSVGTTSRVPNSVIHKMNVSDHGNDLVLSNIIKEENVDTVIHFAARKQVGESVEKPLYYYKENIGGIENLLQAMVSNNVKKFVFSSSAATYGEPDTGVVHEDMQAKPINPYGETKLICEWITRDVCKVSDLKFVGLRYFNAAGSGSDELGDPAILNLIPMVFEKLQNNQLPLIFGNDYDTADGTCIRDYIHVVDLAKAHIDAINYLEKDDQKYDIFNVSTGIGASVKEVIDLIRDITKIDFQPKIAPRRPGDPARLVGDNSRIISEFNWEAKYNIEDIVYSAWSAWKHQHQ